jgi:hypothetical protein
MKNKGKGTLEKLTALQLEIEKLPKLSPVEKAKLDSSIAIDQLYNSSKIEGSTLTEEAVEKAVFGYDR